MYQILLTSLIAGLSAQFLKPFFNRPEKKLSWRALYSYSGMPSAHAAFVSALTVIVGLEEGLASPLFAVCLIFSLLVIRDALGLRRYVGQHAQAINELVKDLKKAGLNLTFDYPRLIERVGHEPGQIIAGAIFGLIISLISFYWF